MKIIRYLDNNGGRASSLAQACDSVAIEIDGIGRLTNPVELENLAG